MRFLGFIVWICLSASSLAQNRQVLVALHYEYGGKPLVYDEESGEASAHDSLFISVLKCYLTDFGLVREDGKVIHEKDSYHLMDFSKPESLSFSINVPTKAKISKIRFNLGVPKEIQEGGVGGGDLDPTKGMYWTWQSGYINFKLEGLMRGEEDKIQYHLGGFQEGQNCLQTRELAITNQNEIHIVLDVKAFLDGLDLHSHPVLMSPGTKAVELSKKVANLFYAR